MHEINPTRQVFTTRRIVQIALMAALVFVGTTLRIKIPVGPDGVMLHFGNVFCLLSGLLFGGVPGGLAAGLGSGIFDLTSEYASEAWITFINKFFMGFVAGFVAHRGTKGLAFAAGRIRTIVGAALGSLIYLVLYAFKTVITLHYINGMVWAAVWPVAGIKLFVSLLNGLIAVTASLILVFALRPALQRAGLLDAQRRHTQP